jgi:hypothetical protein
MPSLCRCCHQRLSHCVIKRRNVVAVPTMPTNVPCGKSLQMQLGTSSRRPELVPRLPQASLVQIRPKFPDNNFTAPSPEAVHPIGWMHGRYSASRAMTPRTPHRPEGFRDPRTTSLLPVTSRCPYRNASPLCPVSRGKPRQTSCRQVARS